MSVLISFVTWLMTLMPDVDTVMAIFTSFLPLILAYNQTPHETLKLWHIKHRWWYYEGSVKTDLTVCEVLMVNMWSSKACNTSAKHHIGTGPIKISLSSLKRIKPVMANGNWCVSPNGNVAKLNRFRSRLRYTKTCVPCSRLEMFMLIPYFTLPTQHAIWD